MTPRPRGLTVTTALLGALVVLLGALAPAAAAPAATTAGDRPRSTVLAPRLLAPGVDVPNPLRGQYSWMGYGAQGGIESRDTYYRDQVYWGLINPAPGVYDFTRIEEGLAAAARDGGQFGFRVMAYCPGCWMSFRDDWPDVTPAHLPRQPGTDVPAWNDPVFLARWRELMAELGRRYGDDPRLGWVDVGGYGSYGEHWLSEGGDQITRTHWLTLVTVVADAFPRRHVLVNTMTDPSWTLAALRAHENLGMRTDCLGAPDMHSMLAVDERLQDFWRTRPIFSEWCHSAETTIVEGLRQIRRFHVSTISSQNMPVPYDEMSTAEQAAFRRASATAGYRYAVRRFDVDTLRADGTARIVTTWVNRGSAPTYDDWRVAVELRRAGATAATLALPSRLGEVLPGGSHTLARSVRVPDLRPGRYQAHLLVTRPGVPPMRLAMAGLESDGSYRVGSVKVPRGR